jgi:hypothetical protein
MYDGRKRKKVQLNQTGILLRAAIQDGNPHLATALGILGVA